MPQYVCQSCGELFAGAFQPEGCPSCGDSEAAFDIFPEDESSSDS